MKVHYKQIDVLKGIAIAMVILGHSIIVSPINLSAQYPCCNFLHRFVSSAHMPLFFAISGFCFSFHGWKLFLKKKTARIIIPLLVFGFLSLLMNLLFSSFINGPKSFWKAIVGILTGSINWFLYTLLIIFMIFPFIMKVFKNRRNAFIIICLFGSLQFFKFWPTIFCIDRLAKYIFYFSIGYYCKLEANAKREYCFKFIELVKKTLVWAISLIVWISLMFALIKLKYEFYPIYAIVTIITAFVGMTNIISFSFVVSRFGVSKLFEETGKVSLQLFLLNGYFLTITRTITVNLLHIKSPVIIIAANVFMMYFVSYALIHFVLERSKPIRMLTGMV